MTDPTMPQTSTGEMDNPGSGLPAAVGGAPRMTTNHVEVMVCDSIGLSYEARGKTSQAIERADLNVRDGEFIAIVGPSGCGKSSFLRVIGGLQQPTRGTIRYTMGRELRTNIVFQNDSLLPWLKAVDNVALGLRARGVPKKERRARATLELSLVGLERAADKYPKELSGGMRQRVNLARAFANEPDILLMDEPFASLDIQTRIVMQDLLLQLWDSDRRTVIFVTHSIDEAILLADRVIVMSNAPSTFIAEYPVPFSRPRETEALRYDAQFIELKKQISKLLREQVHAAEGAQANVD